MDKSSESSPEFEFWMVDNPPSFLQPTDLLTADELFADGVLLPLQPIQLPNDSNDSNPNHTDSPPSPLPPPPLPLPTNKWKNLFKSNDKKIKSTTDAKERKNTALPGTSIGSAAELNIHLWPFSRSRSAGRNARPRATATAVAAVGPLRKSSSAPAASRGSGIHVGRSAPVWRLQRGRNIGNAGREKGGGNSSGSANTCIGYENGSDQVSCRGSTGNGKLFNLRTIFSKKVLIT